jgi:hypothetical protein
LPCPVPTPEGFVEKPSTLTRPLFAKVYAGAANHVARPIFRFSFYSQLAR